MQSDNQSWICCGRVESQEIQHKEAKTEGERDELMICITKQRVHGADQPSQWAEQQCDLMSVALRKQNTHLKKKKQWFILIWQTGEHGQNYSHCNWLPQGMERKVEGSLVLTSCSRFNWILICYLPTEHQIPNIRNNGALCRPWHIKTAEHSTHVYTGQGRENAALSVLTSFGPSSFSTRQNKKRE